LESGEIVPNKGLTVPPTLRPPAGTAKEKGEEGMADDPDDDVDGTVTEEEGREEGERIAT